MDSVIVVEEEPPGEITATLYRLDKDLNYMNEGHPLNTEPVQVGPISYQLRGTVVKIGRGVDNNLMITDPQVSRFHAELSYANSKWHIKDLSINGLLLNGNRLGQKLLTEVKDADIIQFTPDNAKLLQYRLVYAILNPELLEPIVQPPIPQAVEPTPSPSRLHVGVAALELDDARPGTSASAIAANANPSAGAVVHEIDIDIEIDEEEEESQSLLAVPNESIIEVDIIPKPMPTLIPCPAMRNLPGLVPCPDFQALRALHPELILHNSASTSARASPPVSGPVENLQHEDPARNCSADAATLKKDEPMLICLDSDDDCQDFSQDDCKIIETPTKKIRLGKENQNKKTSEIVSVAKPKSSLADLLQFKKELLQREEIKQLTERLKKADDELEKQTSTYILEISKLEAKLAEATIFPEKFSKELFLQLHTSFSCFTCKRICRQPTIIYPCIHLFCGQCFNDYLSTSKERTCPIPTCKRVIEEISIHVVVENLIDKIMELIPEKLQLEMSQIIENNGGHQVYQVDDEAAGQSGVHTTITIDD